jgi:hypothetical protein
MGCFKAEHFGQCRHDHRSCPFIQVGALPHLHRIIGECLGCLHALVDLNQEVRIEQRILVHAVPHISAWIAHHPRSVQEIVEAIVGMSMYPQARTASIDQPLGIGNEASVQQ